MTDSTTPPTHEPDSTGASLRAVTAVQHTSAAMQRLAKQLPLRGAPEPHVARVYDGCEDGRPWFDSEHPVIVDASERARVLRLLQGGGIILRAESRLRDEISGEDGIVPGDLRSDGRWIWSDAAAYYLENHWLAPDPDLIRHLAITRSRALTDSTWRRLYNAIRPDVWEGKTWPLD